MGKTGVGDVPAAGAFGLLAHFQGDLPPSVREERAKGLAGVDTAAVEQQAGVGGGVLRGGRGGGPGASGAGNWICPSLSLFMIEPPLLNKYKKGSCFLQLTEKMQNIFEGLE